MGPVLALGLTKLSAGSELTLTRQINTVVSATLSSGLMERTEVKEDWLADWVVPEMLLILGDDGSNIPIRVLQVKFTITLISSTLMRFMVQVRLRAVPATMGTDGLTGWTTTVGGGTGGRESSQYQQCIHVQCICTYIHGIIHVYSSTEHVQVVKFDTCILTVD